MADEELHLERGVPIGDPTPPTTQQILREITSLRDLIYVRLEGMDRAMVIFQDNLTRTPTETQSSIATLQALHDSRFEQVADNIHGLDRLCTEKFLGVDRQF